MNVERIRELADVIEKQPDANRNDEGLGFAMSDFFHTCGSPSCIAGWASHLFMSDEQCPDFYSTDDVLADVLDIKISEAIYLSCPENDWANAFALVGEPGHVTPAHAAAVLRHLADTGKLNWYVGAYKHPPVVSGQT